MKKKLVATTIMGLGIFVCSTSALAATETTGKVGFTADEDESGSIVKPNPGEEEGGSGGEEIELPGGGESGSGALRIQFVPHLNFGTFDKISSSLEKKNVQVLSYKQGPADGKIAPFVQVTNNSGENSNWDLSVKATPFKNDKNHVLTGAYVSLDGSTLASTAGDSNSANALVEGQKTGAIPTDGKTSLSVLSAKAGADTNGKQLSNVFHNNYVKDQAFDNNETAGVQFVKPAGIAAQASEYTSTITWSLVNGK